MADQEFLNKLDQVKDFFITSVQYSSQVFDWLQHNKIDIEILDEFNDEIWKVFRELSPDNPDEAFSEFVNHLEKIQLNGHTAIVNYLKANPDLIEVLESYFVQIIPIAKEFEQKFLRKQEDKDELISLKKSREIVNTGRKVDRAVNFTHSDLREKSHMKIVNQLWQLASEIEANNSLAFFDQLIEEDKLRESGEIYRQKIAILKQFLSKIKLADFTGDSFLAHASKFLKQNFVISIGNKSATVRLEGFLQTNLDNICKKEHEYVLQKEQQDFITELDETIANLQTKSNSLSIEKTSEQQEKAIVDVAVQKLCSQKEKLTEHEQYSYSKQALKVERLRLELGNKFSSKLREKTSDNNFTSLLSQRVNNKQLWDQFLLKTKKQLFVTEIKRNSELPENEQLKYEKLVEKFTNDFKIWLNEFSLDDPDDPITSNTLKKIDRLKETFSNEQKNLLIRKITAALKSEMKDEYAAFVKEEQKLKELRTHPRSSVETYLPSAIIEVANIKKEYSDQIEAHALAQLSVHQSAAASGKSPVEPPIVEQPKKKSSLLETGLKKLTKFFQKESKYTFSNEPGTQNKKTGEEAKFMSTATKKKAGFFEQQSIVATQLRKANSKQPIEQIYFGETNNKPR